MNSFRLAKGMIVPNLDGIHECYEVKERNGSFVFTANVSVQNIDELIRAFCKRLEEPCFFILEVPANEKDELELRKANTDPFHCDVYYWDGLSLASLLIILEKYGELMINDGMACFGFASHATCDEIYVGQYNVVNIFSSDRARYEQLLFEQRIPREEQIKTVWDNFSQDAPGETKRIYIDEKDIYDVIEVMKTEGLYLAHRREQ